jgi:hypothetical protein
MTFSKHYFRLLFYSRFFGQVEFHLFGFSLLLNFLGSHWRNWASIIVERHYPASVHFGNLIIGVAIDDKAPATVTFASLVSYSSFTVIFELDSQA